MARHLAGSHTPPPGSRGGARDRAVRHRPWENAVEVGLGETNYEVAVAVAAAN
jgi:hypothetical protein